MRFTGISATMRELNQAIEELENKAVQSTKEAARVLTLNLFFNTPVWSGETVRNYAWGVGSASGGGTKHPLGHPPPPGVTDERNRDANESAALADMESATAIGRLADLVVTNLIDDAKWDLIENGSAPTPERSRYPGGVSTLAVQSARVVLEHWR